MTMPLLDPTLPGTPSAMAALMQSLMAAHDTTDTPPPGGPPPQGAPPQGPPAGMPAGMPGGAPPAGPAPDAAAPGPAHAGGITGAIKSLLSHLDPRPSAPGGYDGLLSPEEIQSAKPGVLRSLIYGEDMADPKAQYQANLDHLLGMKQMAAGIANQRRVMQARQDAARLFPEAPNETLDDTRNRLGKMYAYYMANGDEEMVKEVGSTLRGIMAAPKGEKPDLFTDGQGHYKYVTPGSQVPDGFRPSTNANGQAKQVFALKGGGYGFFGPGDVIPDGAKPASMVEKEEARKQKYVWAVPPGGSTPVYVTEDAAASGGYTQPQKAGGTGTLAAPIAAKVGQFGEMLKKAADLLPMMDALNVKLSGSTAQDIAEHGIAHIPGTRGIGSMMLNHDADYARYQAALTPIVLAAAHALSGARINQDQVTQIRNSIEYKPGDSDSVMAQKRKNLVDLLNSIGGSLPADAVAIQEGQMTPAQIGVVRGYGYEGSSTAKPPTGRTKPVMPMKPTTGGSRKVVVNGKTYTLPN